MSLQDSFPIASTFVNKYLWHSLKRVDSSLGKDYGNIVPFFPISDARSDEWPWSNKPYVIYDQMWKMRSKTSYFIHRTQTIYFVKGNPSEVIPWANAIGVILDRQDATAQDLNNWLSDNHPDAGIYFHRFKVMQVDQTNESRMDISTNQKYISTMAIEYEYHLTKTLDFD